MPDGTAVMQRWAEERRARAEEHAATEETTVDASAPGDTEAEATDGVDALVQEDSESLSSLSRFSDGAYNHPSTEGDGSDLYYEADVEELAVNQPIQPETMPDDDDNSSIIAYSVSETSIVLDPGIANQWTAKVIRDLMKPLSEVEIEQINSALT